MPTIHRLALRPLIGIKAARHRRSKSPRTPGDETVLSGRKHKRCRKGRKSHDNASCPTNHPTHRRVLHPNDSGNGLQGFIARNVGDCHTESGIFACLAPIMQRLRQHPAPDSGNVELRAHRPAAQNDATDREKRSFLLRSDGNPAPISRFFHGRGKRCAL